MKAGEASCGFRRSSFGLSQRQKAKKRKAEKCDSHHDRRGQINFADEIIAALDFGLGFGCCDGWAAGGCGGTLTAFKFGERLIFISVAAFIDRWLLH
jgi:hypothetical protein